MEFLVYIAFLVFGVWIGRNTVEDIEKLKQHIRMLEEECEAMREQRTSNSD